MSIEQAYTVDFISIDEQSRRIVLTVSDHLDWERDPDSHLMLLQSKLNSYLRFVESGEIEKKFPEIKDRQISIRVVGRFPMSEEAASFFRKMEAAIKKIGLVLEF